MLIAGLISFGVGFVLKILDQRPAGCRQTRGRVIGYTKKQKIYNPVIEFVSFDGNKKYGKWPVGSSNHFSFSLGDRVVLFLQRQTPDRVWYESKAMKMLPKILMAIGLGLCVLFFKIYKFTPLNMAISGFVLLSIIVQGPIEFHLQKISFANI